MHVVILTNYNLYESKRHFSVKLAEALERLGVEVTLIDFQTLEQQSEELRRASNPNETIFTCSFNSMIPSKEGKLMSDYTGVPHIAFFVDPAICYREVLKSNNSIITCVDHFDCEYVLSQNFKKVFFWPHAVEKELSADPEQERPYDVVFLGTCYDHENLRNYWRERMSSREVQTIETAVEDVLSDNETPLYKAVRESMLHHGLGQPEGDEFEKKIYYYLNFADNYMRGKDRTELIRSIKNAHVHVFGDISWRVEKPIQGWDHSLKGMKNVTIHPPVAFQECLEILKQSKICLNSMPFFKNGTHERIFTGLACGALPITSDNLWVRNNFSHGEDILIYKPKQWHEVDAWVNDYLSDPSKLKQVVEKGREKVMKEHTWDIRAKQLLQRLNLDSPY